MLKRESGYTSLRSVAVFLYKVCRSNFLKNVYGDFLHSKNRIIISFLEIWYECSYGIHRNRIIIS